MSATAFQIAPSIETPYPAAPSGLSRFLRHLRRDPATLVGLTIVVVLLLVAAFAPLIAPYGAN
jgi:ABC-type antimicrobial peptide transport system permease subunit